MIIVQANIFCLNMCHLDDILNQHKVTHIQRDVQHLNDTLKMTWKYQGYVQVSTIPGNFNVVRPCTATYCHTCS